MDVERHDGNSSMRIKIGSTITANQHDIWILFQIRKHHLAILSLDSLDPLAADHFFDFERHTTSNGLDDSRCSCVLPGFNVLFVVLTARRYKRDCTSAWEGWSLDMLKDGASRNQQATTSRTSNELVRRHEDRIHRFVLIGTVHINADVCTAACKIKERQSTMLIDYTRES